jgi:hypothetical protein
VVSSSISQQSNTLKFRRLASIQEDQEEDAISHMLSERKSLNDDAPEEVLEEEEKSGGDSEKDKDDDASDGS